MCLGELYGIDEKMKSMASEKSLPNSKKVVFEYPLSSTSVPKIWEIISTAPGLAAWFADSVNSDGKSFNFIWGKNEERSAEVVNCRQNTYIRFHWSDDEPGLFFEFRIIKNALTGTYSLEVTDFAENGFEEETRSLWDTSAEALRRCGV